MFVEPPLCVQDLTKPLMQTVEIGGWSPILSFLLQPPLLTRLGANDLEKQETGFLTKDSFTSSTRVYVMAGRTFCS